MIDFKKNATFSLWKWHILEVFDFMSWYNGKILNKLCVVCFVWLSPLQLLWSDNFKKISKPLTSMAYIGTHKTTKITIIQNITIIHAARFAFVKVLIILFIFSCSDGAQFLIYVIFWKSSFIFNTDMPVRNGALTK